MARNHFPNSLPELGLKQESSFLSIKLMPRSGTHGFQASKFSHVRFFCSDIGAPLENSFVATREFLRGLDSGQLSGQALACLHRLPKDFTFTHRVRRQVLGLPIGYDAVLSRNQKIIPCVATARSNGT